MVIQATLPSGIVNGLALPIARALEMLMVSVIVAREVFNNLKLVQRGFPVAAGVMPVMVK